MGSTRDALAHLTPPVQAASLTIALMSLAEIAFQGESH